jgi:histidyl-tRNA synthetase
MSDKKIYKPKPISGFPEWLPEERLIEQQWFDHIRRVFESYGFCNIETPSVEELDVLTAKGEVDKEIYVIERLHKDENGNKEARLALHFDQTVPMARYVAMNFNNLVFPFKRYQMQRVWRGERPQMGRMREFYQCDIDIINVDNLPISFDADVAAVMYEVLSGLNIGNVQLRISNRKILLGLLHEWGVIETTSVLRVLDKIEKVSREETLRSLNNVVDSSQADILVKLATIKVRSKGELLFQLEEIEANVSAQSYQEGVSELSAVLDQLSHLPEHAVRADLSIVRGLDYYTGTVYETQLLDVPEFTGSVCSGGRYDDLAGSYINKHLPGVGISIGFSRLFDVMRQTGRIKVGAKSPTHVLVILENEESRKQANDTARALRANGNNVEVFHAPKKTGDQIKYADKKGIPYVWFPPTAERPDHQVKDMAAQTQSQADPKSWKAST